ncbi:MAG: hypothetical protein ACFE9L_18745 [Candidatus Hodarchaeota archaeon]
MREKIIGIKRWILALMSVGILIIIISFLLFIEFIETPDPVLYGMPEKSLFGIEYQILLAFGFYFTFVGLFLILPVQNHKNRTTLKRFETFFLLLCLHGIELLVYSILTLNIFPPINPSHSWFDYYILGVFLILIGFSPIVFRIQDFLELKKQKILYILLCFVGISLFILCLLSYTTILWEALFLYGCISLYVGALPLLVSYATTFRSFLDHFQILWILITIIGMMIYLLPTLILNGLGPMSIFNLIKYFDFLTFGTLIILIGTIPLGLTRNKNSLIHKYRIIWIILLFLGMIQVFISGILILHTSYLVEIPIDIIISRVTHIGPMILGMTWDVYYMNGAVITIISFAFICPLLLFETLESEKELTNEATV